jgi:hypothetical protein
MLAAALHRPGLATRAEVQTWAEHGLALALEELKTLGENPRGGTGEC